MEITLKRAADFLYELREDRPVCTNCTHWTYRAAHENKVEVGKEPYWHRDVLANVITQRCAACLMRPSYPWAWKISKEQLLAWLIANPPVPGENIDLNRLRDELTADRGGFRFL